MRNLLGRAQIGGILILRVRSHRESLSLSFFPSAWRPSRNKSSIERFTS